MIIHSEVESDLIYSEIGSEISSTVEQDTIYSEEVDYGAIEQFRITQDSEYRSTEDDNYRITE